MKIYLLLIAIGLTLPLASCKRQSSVAGNPIDDKKPKPPKKISVVQNSTPDTICIAATGDIMLGSSFPDSSKLPPDSAKNSFNPILKYLKGADVVFGNLEGTLLDSGAPASHKKKLESAYLFRMPACYGGVLKDAGFNLLSIANNHITDFGENGWISTTKALDKYGIHYAGLQSYPTTVFEIKGIKYGFCAFAPNAYTVPMLDSENTSHILRRLKKRCDILIVSFHGGAEGPAYEHIPFKIESYMNGQRGDVHAFAHTAIDAGADVVLGSGPHVCRAFEMYKGRLIAYSLGNFCTYKCVSVIGVSGMAPLLKVYLDKKGAFISANIISFRQTHEKGLVHDSQNRVAKHIKLLTETDFPESGLEIADNGRVTSTN